MLGSSVSSFFVLDYSDYRTLLELRDSVNKEVHAMRVIVNTTNMNPEVLLSELLDKKRRAIARIDASVEGREFLSGLVQTEDSDALSKVLRRLRIGSKLFKLRSQLNEELISFQSRWEKLSVPLLEQRILLIRFIDQQLELLNSKYNNLISETPDDDAEAFVYVVLIEELELLRKKANRKPRLS